LVVFCRICQLAQFDAAKITAAHNRLIELCTPRTKSNGKLPGDVFGVHSSPFGRFILVATPTRAAQLALEIMDGAETAGFDVSIGIAQGSIRCARDVRGDNVVSPAINLAARIAFAPNLIARIGLEDSAAEQVILAGAFQARAFDPPVQDQIKHTHVTYRVLQRSHKPFGELVPATNASYESVHCVVFDLVGFSSLQPDALPSAVENLSRASHRALERVQGSHLLKAGHLWYAPGGDGGAVVFSSKVGRSAIALEFANYLISECGSTIKIRIGIDHGPAAILANELPVGPAVLDANRLAGHPAPGGICVSKAYWSVLGNEDRSQFDAISVVSDESALLLLPPASTQEHEGKDDGIVDGFSTAYAELIPEIEAFFSKHPKLFPKLVPVFFPGREPETASVMAVLEEAHRLGLYEAFSRILEWIKAPEFDQDPNVVENLVHYLAALGIKAPTLKTLRRDSASGSVQVEPHLKPATVECVVSAIYQKPATYMKASPGDYPQAELPKGQAYVEIGLYIEPKSPSSSGPKSRPEDLRGNLMQRFNVLPHRSPVDKTLPDRALLELREALEPQRRHKKHPYYTIASHDGSWAVQELFETLKLPKELFLVLIESATLPPGTPLKGPLNSVIVLKMIHDRLAELRGQPGSKSNSP